jgi:hypothetical protein
LSVPDVEVLPSRPTGSLLRHSVAGDDESDEAAVKVAGGWDEELRCLLAHYEEQTEDEAVGRTKRCWRTDP